MFLWGPLLWALTRLKGCGQPRAGRAAMAVGTGLAGEGGSFITDAIDPASLWR